LIAISLVVCFLELSVEETTSHFRKILVGPFLLIFNFFLLNLILIALSNVAEQLINDALQIVGWN
jgi:hypothetical protein